MTCRVSVLYKNYQVKYFYQICIPVVVVFGGADVFAGLLKGETISNQPEQRIFLVCLGLYDIIE